MSPTIPQDKVLQLAAIAEKGSEHPLGEAIVRGAQRLHLDIPETSEFTTVPSKGVHARWEGQDILVGNRRLLHEAQIPIDFYESIILDLEEQGKMAILAAVDGKMVGAIAVADTLNETAPPTVVRLTS